MYSDNSTGLKVVYDVTKPDGQRVGEVLVRCADCLVPRYEALDRSKMYSIITNVFLASGGDAYKIFPAHAQDYVPYGKVLSSFKHENKNLKLVYTGCNRIEQFK